MNDSTGKPRDVFAHITNATDTNNVKVLFAAVLFDWSMLTMLFVS